MSAGYSLFDVFKKHATGPARDPFSASYGQASISPVAPPPGSIEANRREATKSQADQEAAASNQQKQELKSQQQAMAASGREREKLQKGYQDLQQQLQVTKAQVDAYKARDAMKTPGLSPSLKVTHKRMQDSVKALSRIKRAGMNPPTVAPAAKTSSGPPLGAQSPGTAAVPVASKPTIQERAAAAKARVAAMTPVQRSALKERQFQRRMENKIEMSNFNPSSALQGNVAQDMSREYFQFGANPNEYMRNKGGMLWSGTGFKDLANRNTTEGSLGRAIASPLATGADFLKNIYTKPITQISGGLAQMRNAATRGIGEGLVGQGAMAGQFMRSGLDTQVADLSRASDAAKRNFRESMGYEGEHVPGFLTGAKNVALGTLGTAANIYGGGSIGALRSGFVPAVKALAPGVVPGVAYGVADSYFGDRGHSQPSATSTANPSTSTSNPAVSNPATIPTPYGMGTAHAINYAGGYANPQMFPAAMASQYSLDPDSLIGTIAGMGMNLFGQPNPQTFMQGQMPIRNQTTPYQQMNNAMQAFNQTYGYGR